jgi:hypothetical protein
VKRAYEIRIERGENVYGQTLTVIAASDEEAVKKAKREATRVWDISTGWRCVSLRELPAQIVL